MFKTSEEAENVPLLLTIFLQTKSPTKILIDITYRNSVSVWKSQKLDKYAIRYGGNLETIAIVMRTNYPLYSAEG